MCSDRFPVDVRAVGLLKHRKQKAYMLSVSWSDLITVLIYRTFEEFKKLHKELKSKFPIQSGLLKKSDRTIPKLRDANLKLRKTQNLSRCMEGLKLLETYCQELLKAGAKISQGEDVISFFEAQSRDLDPSFPDDSVIILPSAIGDQKAEAVVPSSPVITQPVISQSYRCVENFETQDTKNKLFKASKEETLEVLVKDRTGWWLVENDTKQIAWFPAPYLEEPVEAANSRENSEEGLLYYVTRTYKAKKVDELSVNTGVVVEALEKSDNGWWLVRYNRTAGYVPSMFLQPYRNPHSRFLTLTHGSLCVSTPNLSRAISPTSKKSSDGDVSHAHSPDHTWEGQDSPLRQVRSQSLSRDLGITSSDLITETDSSSDSSGNLSEEGLFYQSQKPEIKRVGNFPIGSLQHTPGSPDSPLVSLASKLWSNSGFEEKPFGCPAKPLCSLGAEPMLGGPRVPPRPSTQEILQRCTTITKRTVQGAWPKSDPPAYSCNWP
ncbi:NADPH oxidase organizer 1 [Tiliqua scincoides]|uniref:NADPH oxidase organizer 1 n=1 Tax=Tiliqua scincoides TaxID=71010 RepID=UPI0034623AB2